MSIKRIRRQITVEATEGGVFAIMPLNAIFIGRILIFIV